MTESIRVEGYHGLLKVGGVHYRHDIFIHTDGSVSDRNCGCSPSLREQLPASYRNEYIHTPLAEYELGFLQDERPEVVIVGAGFLGMMPVTPKAREILAGYEHQVLITPEAMKLINEEHRKFVAILHITC